MDGFGFEAPGSAQKGSGKGKGQQFTIRPVTVAQLYKMKQAIESGAAVLLDGVEVGHVTCVGKVVQAIPGERFDLDDGTGVVAVVDPASTSDDFNQMPPLQQGQYVRVVGELQGITGEVMLNTFKVRPLDDWNELTFHFLECIFVTQHFKQLGQGGEAAGGFAAGHNYAAGGYGAPMNRGGIAPGGGCMQTVLELLMTPDHMARDDGTHVTEIVAHFKGRFSEAQVRDALTELTQAGSIYSASSDEHFKALG